LDKISPLASGVPNGQNIFIAECKFWTGPKGYTETIYQILKYATWRDTKTAIFIFCKNVDPATAVEKIPEETAKHPNFIRAVPFGDASSFRHVLKHPGDSSADLDDVQPRLRDRFFSRRNLRLPFEREAARCRKRKDFYRPPDCEGLGFRLVSRED
jgi:hypothetical protein